MTDDESDDENAMWILKIVGVAACGGFVFHMMELPRYVSPRRVWALELKTVVGQHLTFVDEGYAAMRAPVEMFSRYLPSPGDFYVEYESGYKSFLPRKAFLGFYSRED
jgi:hypothetical protein